MSLSSKEADELGFLYRRSSDLSGRRSSEEGLASVAAEREPGPIGGDLNDSAFVAG
jgi:hypothetical protein